MADTKGPEIRLGQVQDGAVPIEAGQRVRLVKETVVGSSKKVTLTPPEVIGALQVGMTLLLDDGYIVARSLR